MKYIFLYIVLLFVFGCGNPRKEITALLANSSCKHWDIKQREGKFGDVRYADNAYRYKFCTDGNFIVDTYNADTKLWEQADKGDVLTSNLWEFTSDSIVRLGKFQEWKIEKITSDTLIWSLLSNKETREIMVRAEELK